MSFFSAVYAAVQSIPRGKVATYGQIALLAGNPRMARQVGWALHKNPDPSNMPAHGVFTGFGANTPSFALGAGCGEPPRRLEREGVEVSQDFKVDLSRFGWDGK